jgi:uncharacterized membrane protein YccC
VAISIPDGPYGQPAWRLWATFGVISASIGLGALLAGHLWLAVCVVPLVAALGVVVPWIGVPAAIVLIVTVIKAVGTDFWQLGLYELAGALWMIALLLTPWRSRRLRPFRTHVSEAARAVAGLLDNLSTGDWASSRATAAAAFPPARAAHELTRPDRPRLPPERLIDALARIMHETIALHTLVESAGHRLEPELSAAVAVLAARVRILAEAIGAGVPTPERHTDPDTFPRLAARIDTLRQGWIETGESHADVFVLVQLRRALSRIAATIESAGKLADNLTFERAALQLPDRPHPVTTGRKAYRNMADASPKFRFAARTFAATGLGMVLFVTINASHGYWIAVAAMFTTRDTYGETRSRVRGRIAGTVAGGAIAAIILQTVHSKVLLGLVVFGFALLAFTYRHVSYGMWVLFVTPTMMTLIDFAEPIGWDLAWKRVLFNVAGALIGFLAGRLLWPNAGVGLVPDRLVTVIETHADLVRAVATRLDGAESDIDAAYHKAREAALAVAAVRNRIAQEPTPDDDQIRALKDVATVTQRIRDRSITLRGLMPEGDFDPGPIPDILDHIAGRIDDIAAGTAPARFDLESLADLDGHLTTLARQRRAEVQAGTSIDETTPLRRSLMHAAGVRHAVRGLRTDAEDLHKAVTS